MVIYSGFSHWKWWFSIAMLVYQRVYPLDVGGLPWIAIVGWMDYDGPPKKRHKHGPFPPPGRPSWNVLEPLGSTPAPTIDSWPSHSQSDFSIPHLPSSPFSSEMFNYLYQVYIPLQPYHHLLTAALSASIFVSKRFLSLLCTATCVGHRIDAVQLAMVPWSVTLNSPVYA